MKAIFREYGAAIAAVIAGVLTVILLFGITYDGRKGILSILGDAVEKQETDYTGYRDFDAVSAWHEREKPKVFYIKEKGRFFAGETEDFLGRYHAVDAEGNIYPMDEVIVEKKYPDKMQGEVCDIRDADGNSVISSLDGSDGSICFESAGVYEVYFKVTDRENIGETWQIPIAVDERRLE